MNRSCRFDHFVSMAQGLVLVLTLMLFSGCAVGPDYQRPEATTIPDAYVGPGQDWKIAAPRADLPRGNWWEIFGDAELNQLEADAMAANQDLKVAVSRFAQARAAANVAESALYPRLGFSVQPVDQRDSKHRPVGGKPDQTYDTLTVPFDFSYEIDLWGRVKRSVEAATAQAEASADDVESIKLSLQAEVAADFITLRTLDADKALLISSIEVYRKSLELVRNRRAGGMVSDLDVAQAETVLKTAQAQAPDIAIQRARYQNALAVLTGKTASLFHIPERPLDIPPLVIPPGLPSELLERRPDIAAAERRMAASNANIGVATAAFFPTVKFTGLAGFQSGGLDMLFDWPSNFWAVGPSLNLPLFQGGQLDAGLRQTKAVYEETVARYRQTVLAAFAEVENNLAAEHLLTDEYERMLSALQSVHRQLEIAENRYRSGLATYLEVATAQNAALGIERAGVRLRGQQLVSAAALIKSLGGGWQVTDNDNSDL
ncbi:MAG: efflux transporter outer membrane subunit [Deltaproteobacteria bacterium]|nr:efflux transporter outer membrane subunit [Deltaproteobacteria bacterium]